MTAHDFNDSPDNETTLPYGEATHAHAEAIELIFMFIFLYGICMFPCAEVILPCIMLIFPCAGKQLLCAKAFKAYGNMRALGNEIVVPYTEAIMMVGSLIK